MKIALSFLYCVTILLIIGNSCENKSKNPKETIEIFSKCILRHDKDNSKKYLEEQYWKYMEEDIHARIIKPGYFTSSICFEKITKTECEEQNGKAICKICSVFPDSFMRCIDIHLTKRNGGWVIGDGLYSTVCCDE